jgi:anaerobic selenocysteine-containing dehydrogenase
MSPLNRREFLTTTALGVAATVALQGCTKKEDPYALTKPKVPGADKYNRGEEKWVSSICSQCLAGCGIKVRVVEGRAVKIEGHPDCPINQGRLGPKGQAGLELLYHTDRVVQPLERDGPRGSGKWKPISWDDAIKAIGAKLHELRVKGLSQGLVVLDGEPRGMMHQFWGRFLTAYGSPNHVGHRSTTDGGKVLAMRYMHGVDEIPAYDWDGVRYVLGFGANLFESWCQTIHFSRKSSSLRRGIPGQRVKFVQVSPRFSITAAKADEWLAIESGTYGALALGLSHVLVRDNLFDEAFVREHTFGFEDWKDAAGVQHRGYRDLVMKDYTPDRVAQITGIPVKTIERIAHEMAAHKPAISLADGTAAAATNGLGTAMAIHALNALLGNLERRGGMIVQKQAPLTPMPAFEPDEVAKKALAMPRLDGAGTRSCPLGGEVIQDLPKAVLSEKPYTAQALILYRSNPIFSKPEGAKWIEAIQRIPLVVSCSPLADESTFWADYILPDDTYLERWELVEPVPSVGYPIVGLRQPAVTRRHDTMSSGDVLIKLAKAIGGPVAEAFKWKDYKAACTDRLKGLLETEGASVTATTASELTKSLQNSGTWWKTGYPFEQWADAFKTPSGKFEFFSQKMAARMAEVFPDKVALEQHLAANSVLTRGDDLYLPHWEPAHLEGLPYEYPFELVVYRGIEYAEGGARHFSWLCGLPNAGAARRNERVELNPKDATALGFQNGQWVWVESPAGKHALMVQTHAGVRPGSVAIPLGMGVWPPKALASELSGSYPLLANKSDPLGGILALQGTRVRISKKEA